MKLSTRSRYGVRLMYELALSHDSGKRMTLLKDIAKNQNISEKYLSKLIILLKNSGLVSALRGVHGGYRLAKNPADITIKELVEILEGSISPVECYKNTGGLSCDIECPAHEVWLALENAVSGVLEQFSLKDIVERQMEKKLLDAANYSI